MAGDRTAASPGVVALVVCLKRSSLPRAADIPNPPLHQSQRPTWPSARGRLAINDELFSCALDAYRLRVLLSAEEINTNMMQITNRSCSPHAAHWTAVSQATSVDNVVDQQLVLFAQAWEKVPYAQRLVA